MQVFRVGGCVRDALLGKVRKADTTLKTDRDWVVVGATPQQMIDLGFRPVGRDFPVFLHPQTQEEYALARTERKTRPGYKGFEPHASPDVTLEQDLARRDLTINAMAVGDDGQLIDPHGGRRDLEAGVLRHVSPSFVEDPVRILRLARFAARFPEFTVAPETVELTRTMVSNGEADALVPERVMQELSRGLMERKPSRMLDVLAEAGLIDRLYGELADLPASAAAIDRAAGRNLPLPARFALLANACRSPQAVTELLAKLRAPQDSAQLARLLVELRDPLQDATSPDAIVDVLERGDAFRRPERFELLLQAFEARGQGTVDRFRAALKAASAIDAGAVAAERQQDPAAIPRAIREARVAAVRGAPGAVG
jgi:tRNA nucleotidyltransferase (CCA-adding enzyme)